MKTIDEIKKVLQSHKSEIQRRYKVKELGIFGSCVKGLQSRKSDVDILVEYFETPDLIEFVELQNNLSDLLGVKVDLVMKTTLKPNMGKSILKEVVYL